MTHPLLITDLTVVADDREPRLAHQRLSEALGAQRTNDIAQLIERNRAELERYGEVVSTTDGICGTVPQNTKSRGRPGKTYYLNEPQALLVCIRSDAPRAPDARQAIIEAFIEYRKATAAPPVEATTGRQHNRRISTDRDTALRLAALVDRLERLEGGLSIDASRLPVSPMSLDRDGLGIIRLGGVIHLFDAMPTDAPHGDIALHIPADTHCIKVGRVEASTKGRRWSWSDAASLPSPASMCRTASMVVGRILASEETP